MLASFFRKVREVLDAPRRTIEPDDWCDHAPVKAPLDQLTMAQGVNPAFDLRTVKDVWPEGADLEQFLAATRVDSSAPLMALVQHWREKAKEADASRDGWDAGVCIRSCADALAAVLVTLGLQREEKDQ